MVFNIGVTRAKLLGVVSRDPRIGVERIVRFIFDNNDICKRVQRQPSSAILVGRQILTVFDANVVDNLLSLRQHGCTYVRFGVSILMNSECHHTGEY